MDPSLIPPPLPTPDLSSVPDQGHQESRGGEGEESLLVISCLLCSTEFSHGSDPSNMPDPPVISDGSPFSGENTPVGAPEPKMSLPHDNNGAREGGGGKGGGYQGEEMKLGGGGGGGAGGENSFFFF